MTRALAIQAGLGVLFMGAGAAVLARRGVLREPAHDPRGYGLRIAGMMAFAAGLMMSGFAIALGMAAGG
jgi:hypothetical protein